MKGLVLFFLLALLSFGESLRIAAASSLRFALEEITREFEKRYGTKVSVSYGASGHFYIQIKHGAPYDVFLSANMTYPEKLVEEGKALRESLTVYALGKLALFTTKERISLTGYNVLLSPQVKRIAMANPKYAPYGIAAKEFLVNAGLYEKVLPRLVLGANVSQAFQFVVSGGADVGIVALSLVIPYGKGVYREVSPTLYTPVKHGAVITVLGKDKKRAWDFITFLQSDFAKSVFEKYGFSVR
ncbi:MAG: molybdate ABC transporter substrate-binding protein [Aquificae bacterium]|nr:molybdate ABC transporter substrate-binding protein [Aquificota bacterium]